MPEDAAGIPEKVSFHFFESLPPWSTLIDGTGVGQCE